MMILVYKNYLRCLHLTSYPAKFLKIQCPPRRLRRLWRRSVTL